MLSFEKREGPGSRYYLRSEKGQTMIEYAMVAVFIAIVLIFLFNLSGIESGISGSGSKVASAFK